MSVIALLAAKSGLPKLAIELILLVLLAGAVIAAWEYHDAKVAAAARAAEQAKVAAATTKELLRQREVNAKAQEQAKADAEWIAQLAADRDALMVRLNDEIDHDAAAGACGIDADGVRRLNAIRRSPPAPQPRPSGH